MSISTARAGDEGGVFLALKRLRIGWFPMLLMAMLFVWAVAGIDFSSVGPLEFLVAAAIGVLSAIPSALWLRSKSREFPAFQLFCLSIFVYYGRPIMAGHTEYKKFTEAARVCAALEILVFLAVATAVYYAAFRRTDLTPNPRSKGTRLLPPKRAKAFFTACVLIWLVMLTLRTLALVPAIGTLLNTIWTFGSSAGLAGMFYLFCLMGLGKLRVLESALLLISVLSGVVISFASGYLVGGAWILMVCLIAYTSGKGKLPLTPALVGLVLVNFLQAGKAEMRAEFWKDAQASISSPSELLDIYPYWIECSWNAVTGFRQSPESSNNNVLDRQSLIQMQALVTENTPDSLPFLLGETYAQIPMLAIPRFIWPEKPDGHLSDETLGIYYGIQTQESITQTSIGFGFLGEAWANFGWPGIIGLALFFGFVMRRVALASNGLPINSLYSLLSVVWLGWSFQLENCLSSWLISLVQTLAISLLIFYPLSVRSKNDREGASRTRGISYAAGRGPFLTGTPLHTNEQS